MIEIIFILLKSATLCISMTIAFILLIRKLTKKMLSPKMSYALWLLIILQLIIPVRFEMSLNSQNPVVENQENYVIELNQDAALEGVETIGTSNMGFEERIDFKSLIVIFWIIGMGITSIIYVIALIRDGSYNRVKIVKNSQLLLKLNDTRKKMGITKKVKMFYCNERRSPYVIGFLKPRIIIPHELACIQSQETIEYMMIHELIHIKKHDLFWKSLYLIFTVVFWFNPLVWLGFRRFSDDQELDCDYRVLEFLDNNQIIGYGYALLETNDLFSHKHSFAFSNGLIGKKFIGRRIDMISNHQKYTFKRKLISNTVVTSLAVLMVLSGPSLATDYDSQIIEKELESAQEAITYENSDIEENDEFKLIWPVDSYVITNLYGKRELGFHTGIDIADEKGANIKSAEEGTVVVAKYSDTYGNVVIIDHENNISTLYAHCDEILVEAGDIVQRGDIIASVGNTGRSTDTQLHFEVKENQESKDPLMFYEEAQ